MIRIEKERKKEEGKKREKKGKAGEGEESVTGERAIGS